MKTIEIVVAPSGAVTVETRGFQGPSCREASRFLETALGRTTADRPTLELHEQTAPITVDQRHTS